VKVQYLALLIPFACFSQEVATTLKNYEPILEKEEVRVGRVTLAAGESEGLHRHPYPRVLVALEQGVIAVKRQDGSLEETKYSPGDVRYQGNTDAHEPINSGKTRFRAVVVELKKPAPARAERKPDSLDPLVAAPQFHKLALENERVRVLEVSNKPGEFEPMHKHRRSVLIILSTGSARFGLPDGSTRDASFSAFQTFWEGDETHSVRNTGKTPVRLIRVELK